MFDDVIDNLWSNTLKRWKAQKEPFMRLCRIEPQLLVLLKDVEKARRGARDQDVVCANALWYGPNGFRRRVIELAGFQAQANELRTIKAYDTAYEYLYSRLPDCRGCGEM
jgi:hypothetical protein